MSNTNSIVNKVLDIEALTQPTSKHPLQPNVGEGHVELYTRSMCHVFAIANVLKWGGSFLVIEHTQEVWAVDEDDEDIMAIWHIMSVHDTENGPVIRDILGDRPLDDASQHTQNLFECDEDEACSHITPDLLDLLSNTELAEMLIDKDPELCPLCAFTTEDVFEAMHTGPSLVPPGKSPAQNPSDESTA